MLNFKERGLWKESLGLGRAPRRRRRGRGRRRVAMWRGIGHSKDKEEEDLGTAARKDREKPWQQSLHHLPLHPQPHCIINSSAHVQNRPHWFLFKLYKRPRFLDFRPLSQIQPASSWWEPPGNWRQWPWWWSRRPSTLYSSPLQSNHDSPVGDWIPCCISFSKAHTVQKMLILESKLWTDWCRCGPTLVKSWNCTTALPARSCST